MPLKYYHSCVDWPPQDVNAEGGLCDMIDAASEVSRKTFLKNVDRDDRISMERNLGYETNGQRGLTARQDYHVSYHRSKLHGERVYYFRHSAIEHVFTN